MKHTISARSVSGLLSQHLPKMTSIMLITLTSSGAWSAIQQQPAVDSTRNRTSYSVGYEFGNYLAKLEQQQKINLSTLFRGVVDALSGTPPVVADDEMRAILGQLNQPVSPANATQPAPVITARTRGYKDDYAALNAKREGVVVLPSGVQYEVMHKGAGVNPGPGDRVSVNYEASLPDGAVFDTTDGTPVIMAIDELVVPGLKEALLLMHEGDRWRVVVPARMGYSNTPLNPLRKRDLIYEIELLKVKPEPAK
jgi:FKBP-type peptidyl-prolyl cis-trans isomerase